MSIELSDQELGVKLLTFQLKRVTFFLNPNTIKSYKILQKLSPKHVAHGVEQSTYPNYRHGKACLSKQPPWRAAWDPRLACGRSRVRAPGPAGALRALFFSPLPSVLLPDSCFRTFPTNPAKVLGLLYLVHNQRLTKGGCCKPRPYGFLFFGCSKTLKNVTYGI